MSDIFLNDEQLAAFNDNLAGPTRNLVRTVDSQPWPNDDKHQVVKTVLLGYGVSRLQKSVKELRGVPPEMLSLAADMLISLVVGLFRREQREKD